MQGSLLGPVYGANSPLYSLAIEVWFYALYPILLAVSARFGSTVMMLVGVAVSFVAVGFRNIVGIQVGDWQTAAASEWIPRVLAYWVVWVAGAWLAEMYTGRTGAVRGKWVPLAGPMLIAGAILLSRSHAPIAAESGLYIWSAGLWLAKPSASNP